MTFQRTQFIKCGLHPNSSAELSFPGPRYCPRAWPWLPQIEVALALRRKTLTNMPFIVKADGGCEF